MTKEILAQELDGIEYGTDLREAAEMAKENGLVIAVGESDDILSFYGAIREEISAWCGVTVHVYKTGVLKDWEEFRQETETREEFAKYFANKVNSKPLNAEWDAKVDGKGYSWVISAEVPFAPFNVMEDGYLFCRGIVFSVNDL